ncbi:MAG: imidazole glycerol phosphate synthase subunit HisH [Chloroflexi bacterium]|nr:imidazole glycerol phosphate synthase subunit HisH [Chloroflexota bacterium]
MIAVIDYGAGNLRSVVNTFTHLGADPAVTDNPAELARASKIVLPGVGAFGAGMQALRAGGFEEPIKEAVHMGTPLLGICLGLQYLFEESDEMGLHKGLGLLPGRVTRFPESGIKIPHMGWNQLDMRRQSPITDGVPEGGYAYFVHSYYVQAAEASDIIATTCYGIDFVSIAGRDNVFGVQFHPEKSQGVGMRIIQNFIEL